MFVSDDLLLVGDFDFDHRVFVKDDGLTPEAAFDAGVDGPVDEVFFFIADLFECLFAAVHVDMAGAAGIDNPPVDESV